MLSFIVLCLVAATICYPVQDGVPDWEIPCHLQPDDYTFLHSLRRRSVSKNKNHKFKYLYVDANGVTSTVKGFQGTQIQIVGSPLTPNHGLEVAADVAAKMIKYMPTSIFKPLAVHSSVGVFTASEKVTIFPEFAYMANGNCGKSCAGSCSVTCTSDGRKWEDIAGVGGRKAGILYDNLMCTIKDPYNKIQNILTHEFAHTIYSISITDDTRQKVIKAYKNARARSLWKLNSYAMSNEGEYFAESTSAFFYASRNNVASGGMNYCGDEMCPSLQATREQLQRKDPLLYDVLSYVYTDNRPHLSSGLTICPSVSVNE